ncbi:hypothetical protein WA158_001518 [Blastocystis sp. Blastoise]
MSESNLENQKITTSFLDKLYNILESEPNDVISWCSNGDSFIISDPTIFSSTTMGKYFKTSKFNSFVRQLNFYGFRKVSRDGPSDDKSISSKSWEFKHPNFIRGRRDLLAKIHRKQVGENDPEVEAKFESLQNEISSLKRTVNELLVWKTTVESTLNMYSFNDPKRRRNDFDNMSLTDFDGLDKPLDRDIMDPNYPVYSQWPSFIHNYHPSPAPFDANSTNKDIETSTDVKKVPLVTNPVSGGPTEIPVKIGNTTTNPTTPTTTTVPNYMNWNNGFNDLSGYPDQFLDMYNYNRTPSIDSSMNPTRMNSVNNNNLFSAQ